RDGIAGAGRKTECDRRAHRVWLVIARVAYISLDNRARRRIATGVCVITQRIAQIGGEGDLSCEMVMVCGAGAVDSDVFRAHADHALRPGGQSLVGYGGNGAQPGIGPGAWLAWLGLGRPAG